MKANLRKLLRVLSIFGGSLLLMSDYAPGGCGSFGGMGGYPPPPRSRPPGYGNPLSPNVGTTRMRNGHLEEWNGHHWVRIRE